MSATCQQAKVRAYLRTHDVDASGCDVCDAVGSWTAEARVDESPFTVPAHVECEACEGSGVVGVDAEKVREALQ
jgi:hypothetical protein